MAVVVATAAEARAEAARAVVVTAVAMEGAIKVEVVRVAVYVSGRPCA